MSEHLIAMQREIDRLRRDVERLERVEKPALFLPFAPYSSMGASGITANQYFALASVDRRLALVSWVQAVYVSGTSNGSNYWTIQIDDGVTGFAAFTTAAAAASTWTGYTVTSFTQPTVAPTGGWIGIECIKTGSPGALIWAGPVVRVF